MPKSQAVLGRGAYSTVFKAERSGRLVALKVFGQGERDDGVSHQDAEDENGIEISMVREIAALRVLHGHPHIVQCLAVEGQPGKRDATLVLEYMRRDLSDVIDSGLTPTMAQAYATQLFRALAHCHAHGIVHRDVKPHNILLDDAGHIKLADFGIAANMNSWDGHNATSQMQSLWYRAPDILTGHTYYDGAVDMWSAACVWFYMLTGKVLFAAQTETGQLSAILTRIGPPTQRSVWCARYDKRKLLHRVSALPASRSRVQTLFQAITPHVVRRALRRLLDWEPAERPSAAQLVRMLEPITLPQPNNRASRGPPASTLSRLRRLFQKCTPAGWREADVLAQFPPREHATVRQHLQQPPFCHLHTLYFTTQHSGKLVWLWHWRPTGTKPGWYCTAGDSAALERAFQDYKQGGADAIPLWRWACYDQTAQVHFQSMQLTWPSVKKARCVYLERRLLPRKQAATASARALVPVCTVHSSTGDS